jgi:hypothetical protein
MAAKKRRDAETSAAVVGFETNLKRLSPNKCYRGGMQKRSRRSHGIETRKISISVGKRDLAFLVARAKRAYGGNVSAVVSEMIAALARAEAADAVLDMLGADRVTERDMNAIRAEVFGKRKSRAA